jgi:hypothetical protein
MNINRNNYESYFLLYVDNELSGGERNSVEQFISENPDLKMEMDALKEAICVPEEFSFNKELLIKREITEEIQSKLLSHLDGELSGTEAVILEKQITSDNNLHKEWEFLQKTKLDAAEIVAFPDKSLLYRKEKGRVIAFNFRKLAAAATIVGLLLTSAYFFIQRQNQDSETVVAVIPQPKSTDSPVIANVNTVPQKSVADPAEKTSNNITDTPQLPEFTATTNTPQLKPGNSEEKESVPQQKINDVINNNDRELAVQQQTQRDPVNVPDLNENNNNVATIKPEPKQTPANDLDLTNRDVATTTLASFPEESESNKVMYFDEEKVTRSKLGGFVRKMKRVVERNAKIKTGNLHIGGFDLALK